MVRADCSFTEIYRRNDAPYYYRGNKVLISLCVLALVSILAQRELLRYFNRKKAKRWAAMTVEEQAAYQADGAARDFEGNHRLEFRFKT